QGRILADPDRSRLMAVLADDAQGRVAWDAWRKLLSQADAAPAGAAAHQVLSDGTEIILPLAGAIDLEKECARLKGELEALEKQLAGLRARLQNENFVARAKPEVVEAERRKEQEWTTRREQLAAKVESLCGR
ncbi:MAG: hypothetical protein ACLGIK_13155, partial [Gemmatimonadota bacterium]